MHANFVLLDEINRSSAKTQSAMLEAMQERQTSIGGQMYPLPQLFMVLATQNPIEEEGTYLLPKAQMDRFLLKEVIDYPTADEELEVLNRIDSGVLGAHAAEVTSAVELPDVLFLIDLASRVYVDVSVKRYAVAITQATRHTATVIDPELAAYVEYGASPRGRDRAAAGRPGVRAHERPHLRRARGPAGPASLRPAAPPAPGLPGRRRRREGRVDHRRDLRRRPDAMRSPPA